jgi:D-ribose pyranose/furanose isomerase RbsD
VVLLVPILLVLPVGIAAKAVVIAVCLLELADLAVVPSLLIADLAVALPLGLQCVELLVLLGVPTFQAELLVVLPKLLNLACFPWLLLVVL